MKRTPLRRFNPDKGPQWLKRGKRPRRVGARGKRQMDWNRATMQEWWERYGHDMRCAVTGGDGPLVVGHIFSRQMRPDLAQDRKNVAPITEAVNKQMNEDRAVFQPHAQGLMREWVERDSRREAT